jgi:hypothetical protein
MPIVCVMCRCVCDTVTVRDKGAAWRVQLIHLPGPAAGSVPDAAVVFELVE